MVECHLVSLVFEKVIILKYFLTFEVIELCVFHGCISFLKIVARYVNEIDNKYTMKILGKNFRAPI